MGKSNCDSIWSKSWPKIELEWRLSVLKNLPSLCEVEMYMSIMKSWQVEAREGVNVFVCKNIKNMQSFFLLKLCEWIPLDLWNFDLAFEKQNVVFMWLQFQKLHGFVSLLSNKITDPVYWWKAWVWHMWMRVIWHGIKNKSLRCW